MEHMIEEKYASLPESGDEYHIEINRVSWNNRRGKIEIRRWKNSDGKPGKGLTLTRDELLQLVDILPSVAARL